MADPLALVGQIRTEREALIDLLETLDDAQWSTPSLCEGWNVQDVAAHLAWAPVFAPLEAARGLLRARLNVNRLSLDAARQWSQRGREAILSQLRVNAQRDAKPAGLPRVAALFDAIVHGYDIRRPLGFAHEVSPAAYATVANWHARARAPMTWSVGGNVRRRIAGLRLVADDLAWTHGDGPEVHGTGETLLLMMAGRPSARSELPGPGADELWSRITARR